MSDFAREVCRLNTGSRCCRYITLSADGFHCVKLAPALAKIIEARVAAGTFHALGDNCAGRPIEDEL